jgi:hypothetical protein
MTKWTKGVLKQVHGRSLFDYKFIIVPHNVDQGYAYLHISIF